MLALDCLKSVTLHTKLHNVNSFFQELEEVDVLAGLCHLEELCKNSLDIHSFAMELACEDITSVILLREVTCEELLLNLIEVGREVCFNLLFSLGLPTSDILLCPLVHSLAHEFRKVLIADFEGHFERLLFNLGSGTFLSHLAGDLTSDEVIKDVANCPLLVFFAPLQLA